MSKHVPTDTLRRQKATDTVIIPLWCSPPPHKKNEKKNSNISLFNISFFKSNQLKCMFHPKKRSKLLKWLFYRVQKPKFSSWGQQFLDFHRPPSQTKIVLGPGPFPKKKTPLSLKKFWINPPPTSPTLNDFPDIFPKNSHT